MTDKLLDFTMRPDATRPLAAYIAGGGYGAARKALTGMTPEEVRAEVRGADLRGRGGAGFPAGVKWGFVPQGGEKPKYLCVNADEGEPGTFKDRAILNRSPHLLLEGMLIAAYAVGIHTAYVYIRGEYEKEAQRLEAALAEARAAGILGENALGTGFTLDVVVHRGAGAYICGEETALLESLEGKRGWPRLKPPFPALVGLFQSPTVIHNVETLANLPRIVGGGARSFLSLGRGGDGGTRLFGVSGAVQKPGLYELPAGTLLRTLIFDHAGGPPPGRSLKAVFPGGLSSSVLRADEIDVAMDVDSLAAAGSMLGSGAVIVIADDTPWLDVLRRVTHFYARESCGQCTPCRLGTSWMEKIAGRLQAGAGGPGDIALLERVASMISNRTMCPLGDAAAMPVSSLLWKFRAEIEREAECGPGKARE